MIIIFQLNSTYSSSTKIFLAMVVLEFDSILLDLLVRRFNFF